MEITFLGTGSSLGIPAIGANEPVCFSTDSRDKRLRSSILIEEKGLNFLIDCGPDFRTQFLKRPLLNVDALLITHPHYDHIAGLDNFFSFCFLSQKIIPIYLLDEDVEIIKRFFFYFFTPEKTKDPYASFKRIEREKPFFLGDKKIKVEPLDVFHGKLIILGYKIGKMAYITDANYLPEKTIKKLKNLDVLIINALREFPSHHAHFTLNQSLEIIEQLNPKRAYITHMNHHMGFHKEVEKKLPKRVFLAYDELKIEL